MELFSSAMTIVFLFLIILLITGAGVWLFYKWNLNDKTARKIEIVGYFLLFVVLVWEFWIKNVLFEDFYNSDLFYINEKLGVIFRMLKSIVQESSVDVLNHQLYFYDMEITENLKIQLITTNIIESILKISSTVLIAIGRFQELKKMKINDETNEIRKTYEKRNESNDIFIDKSIPYYNLILKCNEIHITSVSLPDGYHFKMYDDGDEKYWAKLEYEIGDFSSIEEAEIYFKANYCNQIDELKKRCVFVVDIKGIVVGSCIAWHDLKDNATVASLHWLVVDPKHQGKHIGLALCQKVMEIFKELEETPVYIHTQPWSYKAIFLYIKLGFNIQKTDTFSHYENQYEQAIKTLKNILNEEQILILNQNTND